MTGIDVDGLLAELARERRERGSVCTTSLNVVAFVEDDDRLLQWMAQSSEAFAEAHGFRIVLLDASSDARTHSVRTRCKELGDTLVTSLEQIRIGVRGVDAAQLRSVVHALIVPNVRSVVLWAGGRIADDRFSELAALADRVVLFSSSGNSVRSLRELAQMEETPLAARIRDLAYMRLLSWQDLIAQFFDEPDLAAELPSLSLVEITAGSEPEAYYVAAWLASRLGWAVAGPLAFRNPAGGTITVRLSKEGLPRRIREVRLHAQSCTFGVCISSESDDLICLTVEGRKERPLRCVPLHDVDIVSLVERAIFSPEDGGVYLQTLHLVRGLLEATQ